MGNKVVDKTYLKRQLKNFYDNILLCKFPKINDQSSSSTTTYSSTKIESLLSAKATCADLSQVAFSGCYSDLTGVPQTLDSAIYDNCGCVISDTYASSVCREFDNDTCSTHTFLKSPSGCVIGCVDEVNWAECAGCAAYDDSGNYISNTYIRCYDLCSVATSGQYCDLSGVPTCLSEFTNDCGYTSCTGTVTGINLYNNGTCVCTLDNSTALCLGCNAFTNSAYITASDNITGNAETSSCATCDSEGNVICDTYATKLELATDTATFRGSFASWSDVPTCASGYCTNYAGCCAPSPNDYMVVQDATGYNVSCVGQYRFKYNGLSWDDTSGSACKNLWAPEYRINEVLDTTVTQGSSNGVTSGAVYNAIPTDNCQLANTCGYTTCDGTVTSVNIYCGTTLKTTITSTGDICLGSNAFNSTGFTTCTGTVTISDQAKSNSSTPVALCTGGTTIGKSGGCSLGFNTCTGVLTSVAYCGNVCGCANYVVPGTSTTSNYIATINTCKIQYAATAANNWVANLNTGLLSGKCLCTSCALIVPVGTASTTNGAIWITT